MNIFERLESNVRSYCRSFPALFQKAKGHLIWDDKGNEYIDFFAGAGSLNYGHNNDILKQSLIDYLMQDGIIHSLDMSTVAKQDFLETFERLILAPRNMNYKVMFPGPTGTNAVESAIKLARKVTGRQNVVSFTNGFHGMTLGSLALTGNKAKRDGAGVTLGDVTHMPYCNYLGDDQDTLMYLESCLADQSSGMDTPAAFIVETVQAEGGINVASKAWLCELQRIAKKYDILLIIDDIQVGCGRTGAFFSFEDYGLEPDLICLSKSLSGFGLPFAITLMKPEHDQWLPGEHNGTFRGHNAAFVTATTALKHFWSDEVLSNHVKANSLLAKNALLDLADQFGGIVCGRGLIQGIRFEDVEIASKISAAAFQRGLIIETAGPQDEVLKLLPPLTIPQEALVQGLEILTDSLNETIPDCTPVVETESV